MSFQDHLPNGSFWFSIPSVYSNTPWMVPFEVHHEDSRRYQLSATTDGALGTNNNVLVIEAISNDCHKKCLAETYAFLSHPENDLPETVPISRVELHPGFDVVEGLSLLGKHARTRSLEQAIVKRLETGHAIPLPGPYVSENFPRSLEEFSYNDLLRFSIDETRLDLTDLVDVVVFELALAKELPTYREFVWNMSDLDVHSHHEDFDSLTRSVYMRIGNQYRELVKCIRNRPDYLAHRNERVHPKL